MKSKQRVGVILMTYGSPKTLDDIPAYLKNIYGGREASSETVAEFRRRYNLIGGSPLVRITQKQAKALEKVLNKQNPNGPTFQVSAGMRFAPPFITDVIWEVAVGATKLVGIIMSPQYSPTIMSGYERDLRRAAEGLKRSDLSVSIGKDWYSNPFFVQVLARRVTEGLKRLPEDVRNHVPVLFTAHSMPKRIIDQEPDYISKLQKTAIAIAKQASLSRDRWLFCYQSAGHSPEEWLKPDFADIMPELATAGHTHVLVAPVQFLADHLEILYDIDVAARQQAQENGIHFARINSLNTSPLFIKALATVVQKVIK